MTDGDIVSAERLTESDQSVTQFLSKHDEWVFDANIAIDQAHLVMLEEQDIVDTPAVRELLQALNDISAAGFDALPERQDVHVAIEEALADRLGPEIGGKLHTGRSRNDKGAAYVRMALRDDVLDVVDSVTHFRETLLDRADQTADWLLSGYTHLQNAQPTTLGHHLLAHEAALGRDTERLLAAYDRTNRNPLGACAMAGTGFDIDPHRTTELLGFDSTMRNSMDAVAARDFATEALAAASQTMGTLSRLCADLYIWSSNEFGFVELADRHAGTSSIMPQKKNPNIATAIRSKTATVRGSHNAVDSMLAGLPMSLNFDIWEANSHLKEAFTTTNRSLDLLNDAIEAASFNREAMAQSAARGFATATELADTLVRDADVPFRTAHQIIAHIARNHEKTPIDAELLDEAAVAVWGKPLHLDDDVVTAALDPMHNVEVRDSYGGPGEVNDALSDRRTLLEDDRDSASDKRRQLADAQDKLEAAVDSILATD